MKMKMTLIALVISLGCIVFSFQSDMGILTLKTVEINEPNLERMYKLKVSETVYFKSTKA